MGWLAGSFPRKLTKVSRRPLRKKKSPTSSDIAYPEPLEYDCIADFCSKVADVKKDSAPRASRMRERCAQLYTEVDVIKACASQASRMRLLCSILRRSCRRHQRLRTPSFQNVSADLFNNNEGDSARGPSQKPLQGAADVFNKDWSSLPGAASRSDFKFCC